MSEGELTESAGELLARLGTDGLKWAEEFTATWQRMAAERRADGLLLDVSPGSFLHTWFANAIEAGRAAESGRLGAFNEGVLAAHRRLFEENSALHKKLERCQAAIEEALTALDTTLKADKTLHFAETPQERIERQITEWAV